MTNDGPAPGVPSNEEIALVLEELARLAAIDEGSPQSFRARAYERAARVVRDLPRPAAEMTLEELTAVKGIGKGIAAKIREYVETGTMAKLEELRAAYPPDFLDLLRVPGLGPKTAKLLRDELGITSIEGLRHAIAEHRLRELPRLGARTEEKLARALERLGIDRTKARRSAIADAMPVARAVADRLRSVSGVSRVAIAGSLRRMRETVGDVDILVAAGDGALVMETVRALPLVTEVLGTGPTKTSVRTSEGLQVDVRVVSDGQFGAALLYFTGSKGHNIRLRQLALARGWTLNEYGLTDAETGDVVASREEEDIYAALGMPWIPPPMREDRGEIEAALTGTMPDVVRVEHLRGDLHVHTTTSGDGIDDLEAQVAKARERGLRYLAITDHGELLTINGVDRATMLRQREEIRRMDDELDGFDLYHGVELNIGPDGELDYDDGFLAGFDLCVASIHSYFDLPPERQTARLLAAIEHPSVNVIGHPTGRRIELRPGVEAHWDAVFAAAAATETALEINAHLDRLDLPEDLARRALEAGVLFSIDTDAHMVAEQDNAVYGVGYAQRAWIPRDRVVDTWDRRRFRAWLRRTRGGR